MALLKKLKVNGRSYEIHHYTGTVVDEKRWSETETTGSGGGGYSMGGGQTSPIYMDVRSKTTRFEKLILQNKEGKEKPFEFRDWGISCRNGNILTVLWAIPEGKKEGPYILVYNHNSDESYWDNDFTRMFYPGRVSFPFFVDNISWWPVAAFFATPFVWSIFWPNGGAFAVGLLIAPFVSFFGVRFLIHKMAQQKATAFLNEDSGELKRAMVTEREGEPLLRSA